MGSSISFDDQNWHLNQIEAIDIWPIYRKKLPKISLRKKLPQEELLAEKIKNLADGKMAVEVGVYNFHECHRQNKSSLVNFLVMSCEIAEIT